MKKLSNNIYNNNLSPKSYPILILFLFLLVPELSPAQIPEEIKKTEETIRKEMITLSRHLGTTCIECHNLKNFKESTKVSFQIAQKHLKAVELLKLNGFSGKNSEPEISCYTCHQGKLKFNHKEKLDDHNKQEKQKK